MRIDYWKRSYDRLLITKFPDPDDQALPIAPVTKYPERCDWITISTDPDRSRIIRFNA